MKYPWNVESCHGIPYSWINEISWNLDLEPFGWPRTGKLKEFYKTELKRTNNEHPYQNIYKISGTILIYFDLRHSTFWFWPSLANLPKRFLAQNSSATSKCSEVEKAEARGWRTCLSWQESTIEVLRIMGFVHYVLAEILWGLQPHVFSYLTFILFQVLTEWFRLALQCDWFGLYQAAAPTRNYSLSLGSIV